MALVYMNGFEHAPTATVLPVGGIATNGRYDSARTWQVTAGNVGLFYLPTGSSLSQATVGLAILRNSSWSLAGTMFSLADNATDNIRVASTAGNGVQLYQGATLLYDSAAGILANGSWYYFELSVVLATGATGSWELRMNGQTLGSGTTVRTAASTTNFNTIGVNRGAQTVYVDDIYVNSTAADFAGEVSIIRLTPNGNGTYSQLVGSDGNSTDNYLLVDEVPASTADYVASSAAGDKDTYTFSDLPSGTGNIIAIQPLFYAAKSAANIKKFRAVMRSGGSNQNGSDLFLGGTYEHVGEIITLSPFTSSAWTESEVNGMEVGFEVRS